MCGIAGVVDIKSMPADELVWRQLATLHHRGPDASGLHRGGAAVIGQSRLSIIDLVTGDPPITNEDGSIGVALNGEIYNFMALRDELRSEGHHFTTTGDTEVVAHLAEKCSPIELAAALEGMFAIAVWDERAQRLILARDRFGEKPLFYWTNGTRLVFASEIKGVLVDPAVPRRLDPAAVPAYLAFGYTLAPGTFFDGIRRLPPGHVLVAEPGRGVRVERYWRAPIAGLDGAGGPTSMDAAAAEVRAHLARAVSERLVADVPVGAFLSGGLDSSAVVALMVQASDRPVRTFTIGFEGPGFFDEREYAGIVARRLATDHTELVVRPDAVALVERLVSHYDEPVGDSSAIPTFLLCELTKRHVTVALSGDGGDELFAGYERFVASLALARATMPRALRRLPTVLARRLPAGSSGRLSKLERFLRAAGSAPPHPLRMWAAHLSDADGDALLPGRMVEPRAAYESIWRESQGGETLGRLLDINLKTYLEGDLLPKVDRTSMAHALEVRAPFLDTALAEYALRLPGRLKIRGATTKRVLKEAVADLLPAEIRNRRKHGFGVPVDAWFRGDLGRYLESQLLTDASRISQHLSPGPIRRMVTEHAAGRANHGQGLWTLLTLEVFLRSQGW